MAVLVCVQAPLQACLGQESGHKMCFCTRAYGHDVTPLDGLEIN